jgi:hypothetical protein
MRPVSTPLGSRLSSVDRSSAPPVASRSPSGARQGITSKFRTVFIGRCTRLRLRGPEPLHSHVHGGSAPESRRVASSAVGAIGRWTGCITVPQNAQRERRLSGSQSSAATDGRRRLKAGVAQPLTIISAPAPSAVGRPRPFEAQFSIIVGIPSKFAPANLSSTHLAPQIKKGLKDRPLFIWRRG